MSEKSIETTGLEMRNHMNTKGFRAAMRESRIIFSLMVEEIYKPLFHCLPPKTMETYLLEEDDACPVCGRRAG